MESGRRLCILGQHQENISVKCIHPYTPLLYRKTGVCRGIPIFLIFDPKHRLWVLVSDAVLTCTNDVCFEQNKVKKISIFSNENFKFYS